MRKFSRIKAIFFICAIISINLSENIAKAASQDACAIWLCLPGGFPQGCSGAYSEFKSRIKKGRDPLPKLSSCTNDGTSGSYQMGYENFEPCNEGYELDIENARFRYGGGIQSYSKAECVTAGCSPYSYRACSRYDAVPRPKPRYIQIWVKIRLIV